MIRRGLLLALLILVGAGCGTNSFIGRRFDNFTAYYNTFYNARKAFDRGVKNLVREDDPIDRQVYLPIFSNPDRASSSKDFEDAVKKSADVLRDHGSSKWVDDALLLIGKSQFYQQNYVGAEQKFREVIEMGSKLEDEAQFWLARTLIASSDYEDATRHLQQSLAREGLSERWAAMLHLALGELYVKQAEWEAAAAELERGLTRVSDRDVGARAQFLLAQVYETLGRYDDAVSAFEKVTRFNPHYELAYAARISAVRVEGLHGDAAQALKKLRGMERDDKNYAYRAEMAYMRGRILQAEGHAEEARSLYHELLYDPDPSVNYGDVRGRIHYALGELYRDQLHDYVYAAAHFDTAAAAVRPTPVNTTGGRNTATTGKDLDPDLYTREAILDGEKIREIFSTYARVYQNVAQMDSLLELGSLDEPEFEARILEYRRQRARELEERRRLREQRQIEQRFRQRNTESTLNQNRGDPAGKVIPRHTPSARNSGFLYHKDPIRLQEGRLNFVNKWGDRPLVPNWRRLEAVSGHVAEGQQGEGEDDLLEENADLLSLPPVDISGIPRDSLSQARMKENRARARYELANVLFLSIERPDSAAAWYRMVIDESHDDQVVQQAYYALAEVQRALGDTAAANELSRQILDRYPDSEFATRLREQLGLAGPEEAATDTLALAEAAYARPYRQWQDGAFPEALDGMVALAGRFPGTAVAPRALMAAGDIYTAWAVRDSLDLFAPLPLHVPDSLLIRSGLRPPPGAVGPATVAPPGGPAGAPALTPPGTPPPAQTTGDEAPVEGAGDEAPVKGAGDEAPVKRAGDEVPVERAGDEAPVKGAGDEAPVKRAGDEVPVKRAGDEVLVERAGDEAPVKRAGDEVPAAPDSLVLPPAVPAADRVPVDSTLADAAPAEPEPIRLIDLYRHISRAYAQTQYADLARRKVRALEERQALLADTLAADTLAADVPAVPADSLVLPVPPPADTLTLPAGPPVEAAAPEPDATVEPDAAPEPDALDRRPARGAPRPERNVSGRPKRLVEEPEAAPPPEPEVFDVVETMPRPVGGLEAIQRAMVYPETARTAGITGTVMVQFVVDERGSPGDLTVAHSVGGGCDEAALAAVRLATFRPGEHRGEPVKVKMSLPLVCKPE